MAAVFAANVVVGLVGGLVGGSAPSPRSPTAPSPRAAVVDVAVALSGRVASGGFARDLRLRDASLRREGGSAVFTAVGELLVPEQGTRGGEWRLGVDARRTAIVTPRGDWLPLRDARGVALVRDGEVVTPGPEWIPGVPHRVRLVFPAPPAGLREVQLVTAWCARYAAWAWACADPLTATVRL